MIAIRNQVEAIVDNISKRASLHQLPSTSVPTLENHWQPPTEGKWKLNTDGSVKNNGRDAGCGGLLRDCRGYLIFAYMFKLDTATALEAELRGIYHGVMIAWTRGFRNLIIETDCYEAFDLMTNHCSPSHMLQDLVKEINSIGKGKVNLEWSLIGRELNYAADTLAKESHRIRDSFVIFDDIPDCLVNLLISDCNGSAGPSLRF